MYSVHSSVRIPYYLYFQVLQDDDVMLIEQPNNMVVDLLSDTSNPPQTPPVGRTSLSSSQDSFFLSFFQKWTHPTSPLSQTVNNSIEENLEALPPSTLITCVSISDDEEEPVAKEVKRRRTTTTVPKPNTLKVMPVTLSNGVTVLRMPKNKDEALSEISLLIDRRLNTKLEMLPQMSDKFKIDCDTVLDQPDMICWQRNKTKESTCCIVLDTSDHGETIENDPEGFIRSIRERIPPTYTRCYCLLLGFKAYGSKLSNRINKEFRSAVLSGSKIPTAKRTKMADTLSNWTDIENRLWMAASALCTGPQSCSLRLVFTAETIQMARQFLLEATRDTAYHPYNLAKDKFNFYTQPVKRNGDGVDETFRLMLSMIPRVTYSIANSIVKVYPTLGSLMEAYSKKSQQEAKALLEPIQLANGRTVGRALSARICQIFSSFDPDMLIR